MTVGSDEERHDRAARCGAAVLRALALGFGEPDEMLVTALAGGELADELRSAVDELGVWDACAGAVREVERLAVAPAEEAPAEVLKELRVEYARLFTGPGRPAVACYESEYREQPRADGRGRLGGSTAAAVEVAYLDEGVATVAGRREPPDFVAVELEFLYTLSHREAQAWAAGDAAEAHRLGSACEGFMEEHAQRWLPAFAAAVRAESRHPFYAALGDLLSSFLAAWRPAGVTSASADTRGGPAA